jgi:hypothetical protein
MAHVPSITKGHSAPTPARPLGVHPTNATSTRLREAAAAAPWKSRPCDFPRRFSLRKAFRHWRSNAAPTTSAPAPAPRGAAIAEQHSALQLLLRRRLSRLSSTCQVMSRPLLTSAGWFRKRMRRAEKVEEFQRVQGEASPHLTTHGV